MAMSLAVIRALEAEGRRARRRRLRRRPLAGRILGAGRRRRLTAGRRRAAAAPARGGDAGGGAGRRRRDGGDPRARLSTRCAPSRPRPRRGRGLRGGQRQRPGAGGGQRPPGGGRAGGGAGDGSRRQARDDAAGLRAVPLRADEPAAEAMAEALAEVPIKAPRRAAGRQRHRRADERPRGHPRAARAQVTGAVRWRESVGFMAGAGVDALWELGAGKALSGMVRRIDRRLASRAISTPADVAAAAEALRRRLNTTGRDHDVRPERARPRSSPAPRAASAARSRASCTAPAPVSALSGTRTEPLEALAAELGERAHVLPCDLGDAEAVLALPKQAAEAMGGVDILVNNAGITRDQLFMRMSDDDWAKVMDGEPDRHHAPVARGAARHDEGRAGGGSSTYPRSWAPPATPGRRTTPPRRPA